MNEQTRDLTVVLKQFQADLIESTVPQWRHGVGAFMDQPLHVLVQPRASKLGMVVAVATEPGHALTIGRLRDFTPLFASFLHTVTRDGSPVGAWQGNEILQLWAASWERLSSRWTWAGWNPQSQSPEIADSSMGRNESWEVAFDRSAAAAAVVPGSRELAIPRYTVPATPADTWALTDDGTGHQRRVCDARGTRVADFSRHEDARFAVAARAIMPVLGGAVERLTEQCGRHGDSRLSIDEVRDVVSSAPKWVGHPESTATRGEVRR